MKKVFFAMAVAAMFGLAACNNNKAAEETVDSAMQTVEAAAAEGCCETKEAVEAGAEDVLDAAQEGLQDAVEEVLSAE